MNDDKVLKEKIESLSKTVHAAAVLSISSLLLIRDSCRGRPKIDVEISTLEL